eukprot:1196080-Prorocentrum_minimum.AAC.4
MRSLEVVTRHIIENHPSRTYYPVILLTDNVTEVPHLPPGVCTVTQPSTHLAPATLSYLPCRIEYN